MGEFDGGDYNVVETNYCDYQSRRKDCDGDWDTYCNKYGDCYYKSKARDCDGDIISFCTK